MLTSPRRGQQGLSLVELLVGVAIGLFVVAGAATVTATQFSDSRRLVIETQLQQDLRASTDIMMREIRRAGQWDEADQSVWVPGGSVAANTRADVSTTGSEISISRSGTSPVLGFRLSLTAPHAIQMNMSADNWQSLTDTSTMNVETLNFVITPVQLNLACTALCADGTRACWPQIEVREVQVEITAKAIGDPNVVRSVRSATRLRNERVVNRNGGGPLCP